MDEAIAQLLTHMLGNPNPDQPTFGMVTNGGCFLFAKLVKAEITQYALSDMFVLRTQENELDQVLKILTSLLSLLTLVPSVSLDPVGVFWHRVE